MKVSAVVAFCVLGLASAQTPKGTGPGGGMKGGGAPGGGFKGKGGGGGGFKIPEGLQGTLCAAKCLQEPVKAAGCNLTGLFPGKGGLPGGLPGGTPGGMGAMPKPPVLLERQVPTATAPPAGGAPPPKFSLSPEQSAAAASARSCLCAATAAIKSGADACVPSSCATATGAAEGYAKIVNGVCKGVSGYVAITPPAGAAPAATPAPKGP